MARVGLSAAICGEILAGQCDYHMSEEGGPYPFDLLHQRCEHQQIMKLSMEQHKVTVCGGSCLHVAMVTIQSSFDLLIQTADR